MAKMKFSIKYSLVFVLGLFVGLLSVYTWPTFIEITPKYKQSQNQSVASTKKLQTTIDEQKKLLEIVKGSLQDATFKLAYERPAELKKRELAACGPEKVFSKSGSAKFDEMAEYYKTTEGKEYAQCSKETKYNLASDIINGIVD